MFGNPRLCMFSVCAFVTSVFSWDSRPLRLGQAFVPLPRLSPRDFIAAMLTPEVLGLLFAFFKSVWLSPYPFMWASSIWWFGLCDSLRPLSLNEGGLLQDNWFAHTPFAGDPFAFCHFNFGGFISIGGALPNRGCLECRCCWCWDCGRGCVCAP